MHAAREAFRSLEDRAKVHHTLCGDGDMVWHEWGKGEPLVLLHGGSGSWTHWFQNIPALSEQYRVIAADTPGLGDSAMPPGIFSAKDYPAGMRMMADVLVAGIDRIVGADAPFHLCGFSMGGIAGTYVATRAGLRVKTFTLVGASAFGLEWKGLKGRLEAMSEGMTKAERIEVQRRNLRVLMTHSEADAFAGYLQLMNIERARIRTHGLPFTDTLGRELPKVTAPLNAVWGREDVFAVVHLNELPGLIRSHDREAVVTIIDDAGHWVMYERPDAFTAALISGIRARTEP